MKTVLALCVLAALCALKVADGASLPVLQSQLKALTGKVDRTISDMQRYGRNIKFDLSTNIHRPKISAMEEVNNIINPIMSSIRAKTAAAKAEGKDAEHCQENARLTLHAYSSSAFDDINACEKTAETRLDPVLSNVQSVIQSGNDINNQLNAIFPSCYSSNTLQMQDCITRKIGAATPVVNSLSSTAESVKSSGNSVMRSATSQAVACFQPVVSDLRSKAPAVMPVAERCIENA